VSSILLSLLAFLAGFSVSQHDRDSIESHRDAFTVKTDDASRKRRRARHSNVRSNYCRDHHSHLLQSLCREAAKEKACSQSDDRNDRQCLGGPRPSEIYEETT